MEKVVLGEIRRLTKFATKYESKFAKIVMGNSIKAAQQERQTRQKELNILDGERVQRIKIHYNCIGPINVPDLVKLPENNVSVHTRQGVDIKYAV